MPTLTLPAHEVAARRRRAAIAKPTTGSPEPKRRRAPQPKPATAAPSRNALGQFKAKRKK